jgi:hypothetical protein
MIRQRLKQSGMFWTGSGATAIAGLRCVALSARGWDYLWNQPRARAA